ncbi:MAG TPA: hypothetical protein VM369_06260, partial [Candidatus Binatia bacterium]|nr:hypothetical protein [Candidatus Binatia bacterium]
MHRSTRSTPASFALDSFRRELRRALYGGAAIGAGLIALPAAALDDAAGHAIRFAGQPLGMTAS